MSTGQPSIADVLSASSLIVAVIAAFLSLWSDEMKRALDVVPARERLDRGPQRTLVRSATMRVLPLAATAIATLAALSPRAWGVLSTTWGCVASPDGRCAYDDVSALLLVVTAILAVLCGTLVLQGARLLSKRRRLERP